MNELMIVNGNSGLTMTSLEIAELVESRHDKVKQSIERLASRGIIELPPMGEVKNHLGQTVSVYKVDKRSSYIVVAQLSPEFTARLVDRWQDLEKKEFDPMKALNDPAAMRGLLLTYTEKVLALEEEKKVMAPKVDAFDRISNADGLTCITDTAKSLQMRPKDLFAWLSANQWIYRRAGGKGWLAYQLRQQQGLLFHKVTTVALSDGREKMSERVLVTPKGLTKLAKVFALEATA